MFLGIWICWDPGTSWLEVCLCHPQELVRFPQSWELPSPKGTMLLNISTSHTSVRSVLHGHLPRETLSQVYDLYWRPSIQDLGCCHTFCCWASCSDPSDSQDLVEVPHPHVPDEGGVAPIRDESFLSKLYPKYLLFIKTWGLVNAQ